MRRPDRAGQVLELACGHRRWIPGPPDQPSVPLASCPPCGAAFVAVTGRRPAVPGVDVHAEGCRPGNRPDLGQDGVCTCGLADAQDAAETVLREAADWQRERV